VDGQRTVTDAMLVVVGNSRSYGGGMRVFPDARIDDGLLEICIVRALSTPAFLRAFPRVFRGTHTSHPKVTMLRGTRVSVEANRRIQVYADGERVGSLPAVFEVRPAALRLVVGPHAKVVA
jgi:diacylglycerol kinase (ATP)